MFPRGLPRSALVSVVIAMVGLVAVVVGSFLPWVRSGVSERSSFEAAGVIDRFGPRDVPLLDVALTAWIAVPLVCVIAIGLYAVGLLRTAAAFASIVGLLAGTVGAATYVQGGGGSGAFGVIAAGPLTTCCGGVVALAGSLGALLFSRVRPTANRGSAA